MQAKAFMGEADETAPGFLVDCPMQSQTGPSASAPQAIFQGTPLVCGASSLSNGKMSCLGSGFHLSPRFSSLKSDCTNMRACLPTLQVNLAT